MKSKSKITKEDLRNINRASRRDMMIDAGVYNISKE